MINYNGHIKHTDEQFLSYNNRGLKYGDSFFETLRVKQGNVVFIEDHYFRLMASMRMLRMNIGLDFTLEYFKTQILKTVDANNFTDARVRFTVFRKEGGLYKPETNIFDFIVEASSFVNTIKSSYEIELYKDYFVYSGLLSTIKTNNRMLNVLASIYADENGYDNCILLNEKKAVVEAINSNIFIVFDNVLATPPLSEGCVKGIMRKKLLEFVKKESLFDIEEREISAFELQKADEVFLTNTIMGIQPVTKYRKKVFTIEKGMQLRKKFEIWSETD